MRGCLLCVAITDRGNAMIANLTSKLRAIPSGTFPQSATWLTPYPAAFDARIARLDARPVAVDDCPVACRETYKDDLERLRDNDGRGTR